MQLQRGARGPLIVGVNIPLARLEQIPGYRPFRHPPPDAEQQGRPFYSWVYQHEVDGVRHVGAGSDVFASQSDFLGRLYAKTRSVHEDSSPNRPTPSPAR